MSTGEAWKYKEKKYGEYRYREYRCEVGMRVREHINPKEILTGAGT